MPVGTPVAVISVEDEIEDNIYSFSLGGPSIFKTTELYFSLSEDTVKTRQIFDRDEHRELPLQIYVTDQYDNALNKEFTITVLSDVTALNKEEKELALRIYPNPAKGLVYIDNLPTTESVRQLDIYNVSGLLIRRKKIEPNESGTINLDITGIIPGLYRIVIQFEDQILQESLVVY
jgi:hypothetical protein